MTKDEVNSKITELLTMKYFMVYLPIVEKIGFMEASVLSFILYKYRGWKKKNALTKDGFFYILQDEIADQLKISKNSVIRYLKKLRDLKILKSDRRLVKKNEPRSVNYYKIDFISLYDLISTSPPNCQFGSVETNKLAQCNPSRKDTSTKDLSFLRKDTAASAASSNSSSSLKPKSARRLRYKIKRVNNSVVGKNTKVAIEILNYWNSKSPILMLHREGTKRYDDIIEETLPKLLRNHTKKEIISRINKYHRLLQFSELGGTKFNKKTTGWRVSLSDFVKSSEFTYNGRIGVNSWFSKCSAPYEKLEDEFKIEVKDKFPIYTKAIRHAWKKSDYYNGCDITTQDEHSFIRCAAKLSKFLTTYHKKIDFVKKREIKRVRTGTYVAYKMVPRLFMSIASSSTNVKNSNYLTQDFVFDDFKKYLKNNYLFD